MHKTQEKQANSQSQVYSHTREELHEQDSSYAYDNTQLQQHSGSANLPNSHVYSHKLGQIPNSQIATNPELMLHSTDAGKGKGKTDRGRL